MKDIYDFFVQEDSTTAKDIEDIVECLDEEKGIYQIHYFKKTKHVDEIPILKVTFASGETHEYDQNSFFRVILNVVKLGVNLPK